MTSIIVEREYSAPVTMDGLDRVDEVCRWCLDLHRCHVRLQAVSSDGLRSLCVYEAPDADSVRRVADQFGLSPAPSIWPSTVASPGQQDVPELLPGETGFSLVDRLFPEPVELSDLKAKQDAGLACLSMHRVRFVRSYSSIDRQRMLCLYAAPDLESVRIANRMIGLPFSQVWAARMHPPSETS